MPCSSKLGLNRLRRPGSVAEDQPLKLRSRGQAGSVNLGSGSAGFSLVALGHPGPYQKFDQDLYMSLCVKSIKAILVH